MPQDSQTLQAPNTAQINSVVSYPPTQPKFQPQVPVSQPVNPQLAQQPTPTSPRLAPQPQPAPIAQSPRTAAAGIKLNVPPTMWQETQDVLTKIEAKLNGKVVSYFASGSIVADDVKYFQVHLKNVGYQERLFFILVSDGGDGKSAYRIASLLKNYCKELVVVIPEKAASAATMLALAGDYVMMTPLAYLTAVDTSMVHPLNPKDRDNNPVRIELEEVRRSVAVLLNGKTSSQDTSDVYKTIFGYIHPAAFGAMERTSNLSEMLCRDILDLRQTPLSEDAKNTLINKLNHDYPAHGYPITNRKARELGMNVLDTDAELDDYLWRYLNVNRYITESVRTDINDSYYHSEKMVNMIESVGKRLGVKNVLERRLDPILKGWTTIKDEYKWLSYYDTIEDGVKKLKTSYLDF